MHISATLHRKVALSLYTSTSSRGHHFNTPEDGANRLPVDMNRPLGGNCKLELLHFKMSAETDDYSYEQLHAAYWRTCSAVLMETIRAAFTDSVSLSKITVLPYKPEDGSFGISFTLGDSEDERAWVPGELDLRRFTKMARKVIQNQGTFYHWRFL